MKFKIDNYEMVALISLFKELVNKYSGVISSTIKGNELPTEEMLYMSIFSEMLLNLQRKALIIQKKYSVKFKAYEALAFWIEFNGICDEKTQAGNMIQIL